MKRIQVSMARCSRPVRRVVLCLLAVALTGWGGARAQTYEVTTTAASETGSLVDAVYQANLGNYSTISIKPGLGTISLNAQMLIYANVTILGNGNVIDMNSADRAFFLMGNVNISNLEIANARVQGGSGGNKAGGGAGMGAAIFAANGHAIQSNLTLSTNVTLTNVTFRNSTAVGGAGGNYASDSDGAWSGGGGMGGNGATGGQGEVESDGGGGGGGFGNGADGGGGGGSDGAFVVPNVTIYTAGNGGYFGSDGGANGGGGGQGAEGISLAGGGGGGGVNAPNTHDSVGGPGGFGGGGGGGPYSTGGTGGFGGGGGSSDTMGGGTGGFGGGGAANVGNFPNNGGFGGGGGSYDVNIIGKGGGGGGAGMGGAIFAMKGTSVTIVMDTTQAGTLEFSGNTVSGGEAGTGGGVGTPARNGSAIGANIFFGTDVTFDIAEAGSNFSIGDLGGAGDLSDPNVAAHASDLDAQGGLIKTGAGTLTLTGTSNYYTGGTVVQQGTLQAAAGALGPTGVTVTGGTLLVTGGAAISNGVTLKGGSYDVEVNAAASYAGMADAASDFGGPVTLATLLAGTASTATTLTTSFAATAAAANDSVRLSDVYAFSGTGSDIFVLELSMTSVEAGSFLAWLDTATNEWVNAVEGNTGNNASAAQQGYAGSFAAFQSIYGTQLSDYLGAYGTDTSTGSTWAVINHNSDFSIVPEPSTWALLATGLLGLALGWSRSRNGRRADRLT